MECMSALGNKFSNILLPKGPSYLDIEQSTFATTRFALLIQ